MEGRVDRASTAVAAPPAAVWRAWADPDLLMRWLPPEGAAGRLIAHDFRPGGALHFVLTFAVATGETTGQGAGQTTGKTTGTTDEVRARFADLDPPHRLALDVGFVSDDPRFAGTMRMDWTFTPEGDGTRAAVACSDVPEGISAEDHAAGLSSSLGQLARLVEQVS